MSTPSSLSSSSQPLPSSSNNFKIPDKQQSKKRKGPEASDASSASSSAASSTPSNLQQPASPKIDPPFPDMEQLNQFLNPQYIGYTVGPSNVHIPGANRSFRNVKLDLQYHYFTDVQRRNAAITEYNLIPVSVAGETCPKEFAELKEKGHTVKLFMPPLLKDTIAGRPGPFFSHIASIFPSFYGCFVSKKAKIIRMCFKDRQDARKIVLNKDEWTHGPCGERIQFMPESSTTLFLAHIPLPILDPQNLQAYLNAPAMYNNSVIAVYPKVKADSQFYTAKVVVQSDSDAVNHRLCWISNNKAFWNEWKPRTAAAGQSSADNMQQDSDSGSSGTGSSPDSSSSVHSAPVQNSAPAPSLQPSASSSSSSSSSSAISAPKTLSSSSNQIQAPILYSAASSVSSSASSQIDVSIPSVSFICNPPHSDPTPIINGLMNSAPQTMVSAIKPAINASLDQASALLPMESSEDF